MGAERDLETYTYAEAAREVNLTVPQLRAWVRRKYIPAPKKIGRIPRFTRAGLRAIVSRLEVGELKKETHAQPEEGSARPAGAQPVHPPWKLDVLRASVRRRNREREGEVPRDYRPADRYRPKESAHRAMEGGEKG
jgi:hypothetical protein